MEKAGNVFMLATDGSTPSKNGLEMLTLSLMKPTDRLYIAHVYNNAKTDLTYNYQADYIRDSYEAYLFTRMPSSRYNFLWEHVNKGWNTKMQISKMAEERNVDFLVIGYSGIKGPKHDCTVMGTAVKELSTNSKQTLMVIRRRVVRKEKPSKGYDFLALYDGSEASKKALKECLKIADSEKDSVDCVCFCSGDAMESHRANVEGLFKEAKLAHFSYKVVAADGNTQEAVARYLNNESTPDYDFVALGSKGEGIKKRAEISYLGSVAEEVILIGRTNLILVVN
eukprot:TRINITY_DN4477_c0_g1_i5.p2 TRINITY_DN4477_c0_g1~~TRINITY_DN4477_c0_g1_i5.p2  ORF type:complete len:282 (-),score=76.41 TRINITY_DN4477_c0_g1_i5:1942-2787(-)